MKLSGMDNILGMNIIEHADFAADEAWVVFSRNAPQVPQELRDTLPVPCILTSDVEQTKHMLSFLQAVTMLHPSDDLYL